MYKIGANVFCTDEQIGKLIKVAVDPHTRRVTDLVIEKGLFSKEDRVIPVEVVEQAEGNEIRLAISSQELKDYPIYRETDFVLSQPELLRELGYRPGESLEWSLRYGIPSQPILPRIHERVHEGVAPERPVIGRGTRVCNASETIGYIDHLLVDESGRITQLVVRRGLLPFQAIIPMNLVKRVSNGSIYVKATRKELAEMGRFTPRADADIIAEVRDRLQEATAFDFSRIKVSILDGVVQLFGSVINGRAREQANQIARTVAGVLAVESNLMTDAEIEANITSALLTDPRTEMAVIRVSMTHGVVMLSGLVESETARQAAEELARQQPGVSAVVNELQIEELEMALPV